MRPVVLIADDDAKVFEVYGRFLTERGFDVDMAPDGLACVRKLRQRLPAALILDLELPWGGGDGVLAWLREVSPEHEIPVILTASTVYAQGFADLIDPPVVDCLFKPIALSVLLVKLRSGIEMTQKQKQNARQSPVLSELFIG